VLGVASLDAVASVVDGLLSAAKAAAPDARIDGFLVQEMVSGVEAIVGVRTDPLYGPMLLVGSGGVLVELARDAQLAMLPVDAGQVAAMIDRLALARLLDGYRGKPAADRKALEKTVTGLARFYLDHRQEIAEIEINPLMVRSDGQGAVAVDVRVIWK
ncbi:MAG: acetate--CoA ligase family protein, partial [Hyphomicrobiaceae bacterium]